MMKGIDNGMKIHVNMITGAGSRVKVSGPR